jgi:hypothetical protein
MVDPDSLSQGVLKYIEKKLRDLYRWQKSWDECPLENRAERARRGQCRMATGNSCHPWWYDEHNPYHRFVTDAEQEAAVFFNSILLWAAQVGLKNDYWESSQHSYRSTILKAIKAIWKKPRCKLGVCFEYQREPDTFYIPLGVCIKDAKSLALVHWSDMMHRNPQYFHYRVPDIVQIALTNFTQRIDNPWAKPLSASITDKARVPAITWQEASQQEETTVDTVEEEGAQRTTHEERQSRGHSWTEPTWHSQWRGWQDRGSSSSSSWHGWRSH